LKREDSVIGTSVEGRKTSSSSSGKNDSKGEEATFAQEAGRRPGRSAGSSGSKSSARDVSTLKGLVNSVGAAGTSNAGGRASFVGFSVLLERAGAFFAVLFCVFLVAVVGEGRSLAEKSERLPRIKSKSNHQSFFRTRSLSCAFRRRRVEIGGGG
jgi:hypothetical protein